MKKSKFFAAAFAATMFATAACGLVACDKDAGGEDGVTPTPTPQPKPTATYTVTFNAGEGTLKVGGGKTTTLKTGTDGKLTATALPEAERDDYTFKGWSLTKNPGEDAATITLSKKFTEDTTVYAVYKADNNNGGGGDDDNNGGGGDDDNNGGGGDDDNNGGDGETQGDNYVSVGGSFAVNLVDGGTDSTFKANVYYVSTKRVRLSAGDSISVTIAGLSDSVKLWAQNDDSGVEATGTGPYESMTVKAEGNYLIEVRHFNQGFSGPNPDYEYCLNLYDEDATVGGDEGGDDDNQSETKSLTLNFSDGAVTLKFDLPKWATTAATVYVFSNNNAVGAAWPGDEMNGGSVDISANIADCQYVISFKQDDEEKKTDDLSMANFTAGSTQHLTMTGNWTWNVFEVTVTAE